MVLRLSFLLLLFSSQVFATSEGNSEAAEPVWESVHDEVPIVLREPAAAPPRRFKLSAEGRVESFVDNKTLRVVSSFSDWYVGEVVALESQTPGVGIIGFLEITGIENKQDGSYEVTAELLRQSRLNFVQIGDQLMHLDLSSQNDRYKGTTDLIVKESNRYVSSKYKPLFTQGFFVGETAQTLWEGEYLLTMLGQLNYGLKPWLTVNTVVPANFLGAPNVAVKTQIFNSFSNIISTGLNYAKIPGKTASALNLNIHWDAISSESIVSHSLLTVALFSFENAEDSTAIKSLGTSSLQTGYELILDNWDRVLFGPSYNFEKKAVGGYVAYLKIWDKFHMSLSANTTDVRTFEYSDNGYFLWLDAYWRF